MNFSEAIKHSNTDEWFTPKEVVEAIVPYLERAGIKHVLCPFDEEDSEFVKVLDEHGFDVAYSHIATGGDFFEIKDLDDYDAVVSNPPFSKRQAVLEKLFESNTSFAMILNFNGLFDSKKRWELFRENDFELLIPKGRMCFRNDEGMANSPNFQSIWVCRGIGKKQIEFMDAPCSKSVGGATDSRMTVQGVAAKESR